MAERVALVTGGGRRIGAVLARTAAKEGYAVVIHYRTSRDAAEGLAAELRQTGVQAETIDADLSIDDDRNRLIGRAAGLFGRLDLLVNNASLFAYDDLSTLTEGALVDHHKVNVLAPLQLIRDFAAILPTDRDGVVVNMLDHKVARPNGDFLSYTISRIGLAGLTGPLALSLAPRIRVCGLAPGLTLPSMGWPEADFEAGAAATPLRRGNTPEDLGVALEFMLRCRTFTGQNLIVDGGSSLMQRSRDLEFEPPTRAPEVGSRAGAQSEHG